MQICDCLVFIGGDIGNSVEKQGVTAAEIAVLRAVHGNDSVREIKVQDNAKTNHEEERERLMLLYSSDFIASLFGKFGDLPETLEAARVEVDMIVQAEPKKLNRLRKHETAQEPNEQEQNVVITE